MPLTLPWLSPDGRVRDRPAFGAVPLRPAFYRQLLLKGSTIGRCAPAGHEEDARACLTIGRRHRNDEFVLLHIQMDLLRRKIAQKPEGTQDYHRGELCRLRPIDAVLRATFRSSPKAAG